MFENGDFSAILYDFPENYAWGTSIILLIGLIILAFNWLVTSGIIFDNNEFNFFQYQNQTNAGGEMKKKFLAGLAVGVMFFCVNGVSHANVISEIEPNNTLAGAQNVNVGFSLDFDANIENSMTIPHVSILGTGDGTYDWFTFTVSGTGNNSVLLDIDYGWVPGISILDSVVRLYDSSGNQLAVNDDYVDALPSTPSDAGSPSLFDSWLLATSLGAGPYYVRVGNYTSGSPLDPIDNVVGMTSQSYTLNISVDNQTAPVPEPATMLLMGTGLAGLVGARRKKKA